MLTPILIGLLPAAASVGAVDGAPQADKTLINIMSAKNRFTFLNNMESLLFLYITNAVRVSYYGSLIDTFSPFDLLL
jgi:hypothetical protein